MDIGSDSIKRGVVCEVLLQRDLDAITMGFLNYFTMLIRNGIGLITGWFMGWLRDYYYDIFIMLSIPDTPFQRVGHKVYLNPYTFAIGSDRKPAIIDLSQPEWTFSDNEFKQSLLLMTG